MTLRHCRRRAQHPKIKIHLRSRSLRNAAFWQVETINIMAFMCYLQFVALRRFGSPKSCQLLVGLVWRKQNYAVAVPPNQLMGEPELCSSGSPKSTQRLVGLIWGAQNYAALVPPNQPKCLLGWFGGAKTTP